MNKGWRDAILDEFVPGKHTLSLVADPDNLLTDELVMAELQQRGFAIEQYDDPIAFRYVYESVYRPPQAKGDVADLVVLVRQNRGALEKLPYDLLRRGRQLDFSLSNLFPNLARAVVGVLDTRDLDALYTAQHAEAPAPLGDNDSKDFVLRHVYHTSAGQLKSDADILGALLSLHVSGRQMPPALAERLVAQIHGTTGYTDWPLMELFTDGSVLLSFLQERWPLFLNQLAAEAGGADRKTAIRDVLSANEYMLKWPGQPMLPFDKPTVQAFVDTLFLERQLRPVKHPQVDILKQQWVTVGLQDETDADQRRRLEQLLEKVGDNMPSGEAVYQDWIQFAGRWAELVRLSIQTPLGDSEVAQQLKSLQAEVDTAFQDWLSRRYHNLAALSPHPPIMVHHIARSLARTVRANNTARVALVVIDGLALDQWIVVGDALRDQFPDQQFDESAVFAWVPTSTAVSRQALFAGKTPAGFPESVETTAAEPSLWSAFWENNGLDKGAVDYAKGLRHSSDMATVDALVSQARMRAVGLVVNQLDEMMHGEKLGTRGLHASLQLWLEDGFLFELLRLLLDHHFQIAITADHGNIEAMGIGSPREQALAMSRGSRARVYRNQSARATVHGEFPSAVLWPPDSLPPDYWPLLAPNRAAFEREGVQIVTHGGSALEEVIVPYIRLRERKTP